MGRLRRTSACLIIGMIASLAVAWLCARRAPNDWTRDAPYCGELTSQPWWSELRHQTIDDYTVVHRAFGIAEGWYVYQPPDARVNPSQDKSNSELALGWPVYCVRARTDPFWGTYAPRGDGFHYAVGSSVLRTIIAAAIIPVGLLANTLFYATISAVPILLIPALRRRHRRLRGRCVHCGYTLAGLSTCPECGTCTSPHATPA